MASARKDRLGGRRQGVTGDHMSRVWASFDPCDKVPIATNEFRNLEKGG